MSDQPQTLSINVGEDIKMIDIPPGTPGPKPPVELENMSDEEKRTLHESYMAEMIRLLGLYVEPHKTISRWVSPEDVPQVIADGKEMMALCDVPREPYRSAFAIAHSQISKEPLRFFVLNSGKVIINPVIGEHTKTPVLKDKEGCMTFPKNPQKTLVPRFNKINVTYQTLGLKNGEKEPSMTTPITEELNGEQAWVWQHECGHLNGGYVYDEDFSPEACVGLTGTVLTKEEMDNLFPKTDIIK